MGDGCINWCTPAGIALSSECEFSREFISNFALFCGAFGYGTVKPWVFGVFFFFEQTVFLIFKVSESCRERHPLCMVGGGYQRKDHIFFASSFLC